MADNSELQNIREQLRDALAVLLARRSGSSPWSSPRLEPLGRDEQGRELFGVPSAPVPFDEFFRRRG